MILDFCTIYPLPRPHEIIGFFARGGGCARNGSFDAIETVVKYLYVLRHLPLSPPHLNLRMEQPQLMRKASHR